ncbi:MAG: hypothetical protein ACOX33_04805 [Dethiobacteria bacterium]
MSYLIRRVAVSAVHDCWRWLLYVLVNVDAITGCRKSGTTLR